jgi:hypothetical protein
MNSAMSARTNGERLKPTLYRFDPRNVETAFTVDTLLLEPDFLTDGFFADETAFLVAMCFPP